MKTLSASFPHHHSRATPVTPEIRLDRSDETMAVCQSKRNLERVNESLVGGQVLAFR